MGIERDKYLKSLKEYSVFFLGADPEFFLLNKEWKIVPAHTAIQAKGKGEFRPSFRDGYVVEINTLRQTCRETLHSAVLGAFPLDGTGPRYRTLLAKPATKVDLSGADLWPSDVKVFGCRGSRNAYTNPTQEVGPDIDGLTHPYRYAGGHMHLTQNIALSFLDYITPALWLEEEHPTIVKLLDRFVSVPLTILTGTPETFLRRRYYGRAGEFRVRKIDQTTMGIEYRTPGPEMWSFPFLNSLAFGVARQIIMEYTVGMKDLYDPSMDGAVQRAINEGEGLWDVLAPFPGWYDQSTIKALLSTGLSGQATWQIRRHLPSTFGFFQMLHLLGMRDMV